MAEFKHNNVKQLNGARLNTPSSPIVETTAMGLGTMALMINSWESYLLK